PGNRGETVAAFQRLLGDYGYGVDVNGEYDAVTGEVVTAFQRHFRPDLIDGIADASTRSTLADLIANRGRTRTIAARARNPMLQTTF
ncbi:MAG TPA: peptidoglycan-binding protein, partial [Xanthobacteraceae bacterium]